MTVFRYKAISPSGEVTEGDLEAPSQAAALAQLQDMGHMPIRAELTTGKSPLSNVGYIRWNKRISTREAGIVARELATLLHAGLPLDRSIEILVDLNENETLRKSLQDILNRLKGGSSIADAFASQGKAFPPYFVSMIRAAEASGTLDSVLLQLAEYMERTHTAAETIKSALVYPIILLLMAGISIIVLMTVVVPQFKPLFEDAGQALPLATQIVIAVAEWFQKYWPIMIGSGLLGYLVLRLQVRHPKTRVNWDRFLLSIPLVGDLILKNEVARFGRTLGTLLQNGVTLLNAMVIVRDVHNNAALSQLTGEITERIRQGQGLTRPLTEAGLFPQLAVQLIRVGEESGKLDEILLHIAEIFDREVRSTMDRFLALLVPVLTIGLGILIAGIIASVLVAILSINKLAI